MINWDEIEYNEWNGHAMFYNRAAEPITFRQYGELHKKDDYTIIARTEYNDIAVSTVWQGHDHSLGLSGPPIIFETMIFGGLRSHEYWRYATEDQAKAGHAEVCSVIFAKVAPN